MKHLLHLLIVCLFIVSATASFGEATEVEVEVDHDTEAPFSLAVEGAWLVEAEEGEALKLEYTVTNESGETMDVQGISLGIYTEGGELERTIDLATSTELAPGKQGSFLQTFNPSSVGTIKPTNGLSVRATASSGRTCVNQLTSGCFGADFLCEQKCNRGPLGTDAGVAAFFCGDCYQQWDAEQNCYVETCTFICICNETIWPDQMPGHEPWEDPLDGPPQF